MFDSIFLIVFGIPVGLFLLALAIGMIRDMFPERKSVLEKRNEQLRQELEETKKTLEQKDQEQQSAIRKAVEDETSDLKDRLSSLTKENARLNSKLHQIEEKYNHLADPQPSSNKEEQTKIQTLEKKLSRIEAFCPSFDDLLSGDISPAEYELVLIDRVPLYSPAGEVNNIPITKAEAPSVTFSFRCEVVRALYRQETQKNRLKTALSENISARFLSPISVDVQNPLSVSVLIDPNTRSKEKREAYATSLSRCSCYDFRNTLKGSAACKHMFALALSLNLINKNGDFVNHIPF